MKICGIEIKGSEAILAIVQLDGEKFAHIKVETKKISLADDENSVNVKSFCRLIQEFVRDNGLSNIAIKKRMKKGEYAGGPITFKIEGLVQLVENCLVELVAPQTVAAANKNHNFALPASLLKYQSDAFLTACTLLAKSIK
ncbi:MAG: DUF3010 family protein [Pseudomonadota bacterium]